MIAYDTPGTLSNNVSKYRKKKNICLVAILPIVEESVERKGTVPEVNV
jgi:hypothetical protein